MSEKITEKKDMQTPADLNDKEILIVDGNAEIRETLIKILSKEGYEITGVGTIALAKKKLKKKFYSVVLVDLKLPDGTVLELLKEIKKTNNEISIIIYTGLASLEDTITALNEGAFAYIQKPLNIDEVKIQIKKALKIQKLSFDNKNLINRLKELSLKDPHTELYNYRYLIERLISELKRARRYVFPLSILMLDIDYFKSINDVYGHLYGDKIIIEFSKHLRDFVRLSDVVTRYGGEEFVILLPDTDYKSAARFGNRLLDSVGRHLFDPEGKKIRLKVSIGISNYPGDDGEVYTASGLLNSADKALLYAKEMGGNRVSTFKIVSENIENNKEKGEHENVDELREKLSKMINRVDQTLLESIYAFAKTIEAKDNYTSEHAENMVAIVTEIGKRLNLSYNTIENLKHAAVLHDLGKVGIPDSILHKRKRLTKKEYEIIKTHPQIGSEIIRPVHFLRDLAPIILYHHERFDGLGYSAGLKGKEIPLGARIIAVADAYQALISDRPYRKAHSEKRALKIIKEGSGSQFDPEIVDSFMVIVENKSMEFIQSVIK
jgi:diguanylate cyclase (GGDEF)-like protein